MSDEEKAEIISMLHLCDDDYWMFVRTLLLGESVAGNILFQDVVVDSKFDSEGRAIIRPARDGEA